MKKPLGRVVLNFYDLSKSVRALHSYARMEGKTLRIQPKEKSRPQLLSKRRVFVLEIEEGGKIKKLVLEERQICWEGFREVNGRLIRGVPKRSKEDCFKYCRHEGCGFL